MKEFLGRLLVVVVAALAPIQAVIATIGVLVFADMITGVWAAYKRGQKIRSAALRRTVSKFLIYQIAIITGFLVEHYLVDGAVPVVKLLGGMIGLVELKSILENANFIMGKDLFKLMIERLGSQNDVRRLVDNESNPEKK